MELLELFMTMSLCFLYWSLYLSFTWSIKASPPTGQQFGVWI